MPKNDCLWVPACWAHYDDGKYIPWVDFDPSLRYCQEGCPTRMLCDIPPAERKPVKLVPEGVADAK